jgi:hypothetical protein
MTNFILALRSVVEKTGNEDVKRAILLLGSVIRHQIEPSEKDLKLLAQMIVEIEDEEESDDE